MMDADGRKDKLEQVYPEPTVGALIFNDHGKVLLVRSHKWRGGKLTVPGGHIELGESAEEGIVREVKEETGLDVLPSRLLMIQEAICPEDYFKRRHFIFIDFLCRALSDKVSLDMRELHEYRWYEMDEINEEELEPFTRNLLNAYKESLGKESDKIYHKIGR